MGGAPQRPAKIRIQGLNKVFPAENGDFRALSGVDLHLGDGEFVSLLGPSGCGKSTLLRLIAGLESITSGSLEVDGRSLDGPPAGLGMVFQRDVLLDWRSILDNVLLPVEFAGGRRDDYVTRARDLLVQYGLAGFEDRHPWQLSGGMRQRAAICRALILDPSFLIMDEPFGALDALTRDELNIELQRLWQTTRKSVLFVTHSIAEAVFLSDRVVVMATRPGRIVETIAIDLPRPRDLAIRETASFGRYSAHIRDLFERHGVLRTKPS
ncbi:MAG: ABC transporter ATP-binding protein [Alphaproteobacteria bacterium]|nr:ABC transporter ATP-binding protein [Alphaproteobacteria bacterium]